MAVKNYNPFARLLHWLIAIIIIAMICAGFYMVQLADAHPDKSNLYSLHQALGFTLLWLIPIRFVWFLLTERPPIVATSSIEKTLTLAMHYGLYLVMFIMPVSGFLMVIVGGHDIDLFGLMTINAIDIENEQLTEASHLIHHSTAWIIAILSGLHILTTLKHHLINKDDTLLQMLGRVKSKRRLL